jgi:hypothetical protein
LVLWEGSEWCHCAAEYTDGGDCRKRILRPCTAEAKRIAVRAIGMDEEENLIYDVRSYQVNNLSCWQKENHACS